MALRCRLFFCTAADKFQERESGVIMALSICKAESLSVFITSKIRGRPRFGLGELRIFRHVNLVVADIGGPNMGLVPKVAGSYSLPMDRDESALAN